MCRIFGFRSVLQSGVHASLVSAENALSCQSRRHPDGWGLAYYLEATPHVVKSTDTAETDELFKRVSGVVSSETVLAHVRKATQGKLSLINTHPFQHGQWTFAHNGNIRDFEKIRPKLESLVPEEFRRWRLGETDSELIFQFLLSRLAREISLSEKTPAIRPVLDAVAEAALELNQLIGPLSQREVGVPTENYLTFVLTNGRLMLALQGGLGLNWSTHKTRCPERDTCKSFAPLCEARAQMGDQVNHLIISSEPLQGQNLWQPLGLGDMIAVDEDMRLHHRRLRLLSA